MKTKNMPILFTLVCAFVLVFQLADATSAKPAAATSSSVQVPRTGQRTCYAENGAVIDCAGTGQDGEYQAGAAWPDPRFDLTYCTSAGPCTDQTADCDGNAATDVILDRLTGLMWTRSGSLLTTSVPWETALSFANNLTLCGYSDWRLPNVLEQQSMINAEFSPYTYPNPEYNWLHEAGFADVYTEFYWTSTAVPGQPGSYFTSRGMFGGTIQIEASSDYLDDWQDRAWPVRAGQNGTPDPTYPVNLWKTGQETSILAGDDGDLQMGLAWPEPRFSVVQDDCVIDNMTGLMWPREIWKVDEYGYPEDTLDWPASLNRARNFILCGYDDWRLPNEWEMLSLIDFSQSAPALPQGHPFKNALFDSDYATSTSYPWWTDYLFFMNIEAGPTGWHFIDSLSKDPAWYYSMPVRGGILGEPLLPDLTINYNYGQPGSYLTITGNFFAPHDTLYMTMNGVAVGEPISVTGKGDFKVSFDTKDADEGTYNVRVSADAPASPTVAQAAGPQASITFVLDETAPHYDWDGTQPVIVVPAGLATNPKPVFLPVVMK